MKLQLRIEQALANGPGTIGQLADSCAAHPNSVFKALVSMERKGVVTRHSSDGKLCTFTLTGEVLKHGLADRVRAVVVSQRKHKLPASLSLVDLLLT